MIDGPVADLRTMLEPFRDRIAEVEAHIDPRYTVLFGCLVEATKVSPHRSAIVAVVAGGQGQAAGAKGDVAAPKTRFMTRAAAAPCAVCADS